MEAPPNLSELARRIRVHAIRMANRAGSCHVGSSLSMAEILSVLYGKVLRVDPAEPEAPGRDRFVLSKGHACGALYSVLAECGFFPLDWLETFFQNGGRLPGHATAKGIPGIEVSTGSLGHGLPIATGMALAARRDRHSYRVFCVLSDGECDEGSNWEAALFAPHHQLDNLIAIVDYNKIQSLGHVNDVLPLEPFTDKWRAFGWHTVELDGHSIDELTTTLEAVPLSPGKPTCVIAHTIKGKGVDFMEDQLLWHYRTPRDEEFTQALAQLGEVA